MSYKCIKSKTCSQTPMFFNQLVYYCLTICKCIQRNQILSHYKLLMHSKESNTIALQITIVFKGIKILLHCEMSAKEPNTIAI